VSALSVERMLENHAEFERDWQRRLSYLVSNASAMTFTAAWQSAVEAVRLTQEMIFILIPTSHTLCTCKLAHFPW
jgi:hypothetical protein